MSPLVHPLGPTRVVHGIPVTPVRVQLLDGCELRITPAPAGGTDLLALIHGTLLYAFTGVGLRQLLTSYTGISGVLDGSRVVASFRQRVAQMRPAGLALLTRPQPYSVDFLRHLESAVLKRLTMRTRALNAQTSAREASRRLTPGERALADALAQQIADAISVYALGGFHNPVAWGYRNARDLAAALIHRLAGRAVDTHQVVQMLADAGAVLTAKEQDYVSRRDLRQREPESGNVRIGHIMVGRVAVYYPAGVITAQQARADYAQQRQHVRRGPLPIPFSATSTWCPCPYCTPVTAFSTAVGPGRLSA
jgi:hypothetical protein